MKTLLVVVCMILFPVISFGQNGQKMPKEVKGDTSLYFYGSLKLNSGLQLLTSIDSIKTSKENLKKYLFNLNSTNAVRLLNAGKVETGKKDLKANVNKYTNILSISPTLEEAKVAMDKFLNANKGSVLSLINFKFNKPKSTDEIGSPKRFE